MKFRWLWVFALGMAVAAGPALAQISVYADMSASKLTGGIGTTTTSVLYGPTLGIAAQVTGRKHFNLSGDLRAGFYGGAQRLDEIALGPKVTLSFRKNELYVEGLVGFGRYNDGLGHAASGSTDSLLQLNFGLDRRIKGRFDWRVIDFGYEEYYGLGGEYNPKTFSTGVVMHLSKR